MVGSENSAHTVRIVALCGSVRRASFNRQLMATALTFLPSHVDYEWAEIGDLPVYNEDLEAERPPAVHRIRRQIQEADGILMATPEYNHSLPGGLKNAIDWLSRNPSVLAGKPLVLMGVSIGRIGTARAQMQWREVFYTCQMIHVPQPEIYVTIGGSFQDGRLVKPDAVEKVRESVLALVKWIETHRPSPADAR